LKIEWITTKYNIYMVRVFKRWRTNLRSINYVSVTSKRQHAYFTEPAKLQGAS